MQEANFDEVLEKLLATDKRYHRDAYYFLREALDFTQKLVTKESRSGTRQTLGHHVTVQELLSGIRQFALAQYGPMAITVLEEWGVTQCSDFGELVFTMIEAGLLAKTENDSREDFKQGYDFTEAFRKPYWPGHKLKTESTPKVDVKN